MIPDPRFSSIRLAVIKLTNRCNIKCKYCYEDILANGKDMTTEIFQKIVQTLLASSSESKLSLLLHGGEPTLLSEEWFEENLEKTHELSCYYKKEVKVDIQSNLIDLTDSKIEIFKRFNVNIGGSVDNPNYSTEYLRPLSTKAYDNYLRLKNKEVRVGILSTINQSNLDIMGEFCDWLSTSLNEKSFVANVAYSVGNGDSLISPKAVDIFNAQKDIINYMINSDGIFFEHNLSEEIILFFECYKAQRKRPGSLCNDMYCGAGSKVLSFTLDGDILPCGRFAWSDSNHYLGNINSRPLISFFKKKKEQFHKLNSEIWKRCSSCKAKAICNFGCRAFIARSKCIYNIECEPTKLRFEYYCQIEEKLQKLYEQICNFKSRPAMSSFDQKLYRLHQTTPPKYHAYIQKELEGSFS
ncbi:MAG: radical SAM protein [Candidatus Electrothrix sp. AR5]|nr:radical SAM protein [Candidatus Electrothrix sp. AR5]